MTDAKALPGLLDPHLVLERLVEDLSTRVSGMANAQTVEPVVLDVLSTRGMVGTAAELGA